MPIKERIPSLQLTSTNYWQELESMVASKKLPAALADTLKDLLASHLKSIPEPNAPDHLIELMKIHVPDGILLRDSNSPTKRLYDVLVFIPTNTEEYRTTFRLIELGTEGSFCHLKDL